MLDLYSDFTQHQGQLGTHIEILEMCDLAALVRAATEREIRAKEEEALAIFELAEDSPSDPLAVRPAPEALDWAYRVAVGLDRLVADFALDGLTYYYRGLDHNEYERIAAGFALGCSLLTSRGVPCSGEGDLKNCQAMKIVDTFGAGGSYSEVTAMDFRENFILAGHDGPFHLAISSQRPLLRGLELFHGKRGAGVGVQTQVRHGPVTLLSMTQRVARPMKFAAFISIIISVAVMLAACQGAVGPKGDKGDDGTDATAGTPAFQPLSAKADSPSVVITDATDEDDMPVAGAAQTIDLADYIRGTGERKYGTPASSIDDVAARIFDAKLDGSMLTITPKATQPSPALYAVETFMVEISDDGESTAIMLDIPARRNRKPVTPDDDGAGTVGTQAPAEAPDSVPVCPALGECYVVVTFTDLDAADADNVAEEKLSFTATSADTSKVEVVSVDNGVDGDGETQPLVAHDVVKGVASTWDAAANNDDGAHDTVEVIIVATDEGGATVRGKANISRPGRASDYYGPALDNGTYDGTIARNKDASEASAHAE